MAHEAGRFVLYSEPHCPLSSRAISHGHREGHPVEGGYLRDD